MQCSLDTLVPELLIIIFNYLELKDLYAVRQTCKRFNVILDKLMRPDIRAFVTNLVHPISKSRCLKPLPLFERLRISKNWCLGCYKEKSVLRSPKCTMPWIHLENEMLWISRGSSIKAYKRNFEGINVNDIIYNIEVKSSNEILKFVKRDDLILCGQVSGALSLWSMKNHKLTIDSVICHNDDIHSVDFYNDVIITGSRDDYVSLWHAEGPNLVLQSKTNLGDRVWSVALLETKNLFAVGTAGWNHNSDILIFDVFRKAPIINFGNGGRGLAVFDLEWVNSTNVWSCGRDSCVRNWDIRTEKCEQKFSDPFGSGIYCFQYDHCNTMISGTQDNGRVVLWDTRKQSPVQIYFMDTCKERYKSSPVYSLDYDPEFLFTATSHHLNILNFSGDCAKRKDYSTLIT